VKTMKEIIRKNIHTPYSLHDMNVIGFEILDNDLVMTFQSGMCRISDPVEQVDGYVKFLNLDWDFCFVTLIREIVNEGPITGEKMTFLDFIKRYEEFSFSIIDEVFGYNKTKFWGWLSAGESLQECIIELYHLGDMVYVDMEPASCDFTS